MSVKKKICVAGCSVSDYTEISSPYGKLLSHSLGLDYLHEAGGCGSNYRIWRRITNHILDGNITENDILIIQYTEVIRNEFWSMLPPFPGHVTSPDEEPWNDGGRLLRWKPNADEWQPNFEEKEFFKMYEKYFVSVDFAITNFKVNNFNFQNMLKNKGIKTIFFTTTRIGPGTEKMPYVEDYFKPYEFFENSKSDYSQNLAEGDTCHFSQLGHNIVAKNLKNHIIQLGWV
jgi:hypothetical protein